MSKKKKKKQREKEKETLWFNKFILPEVVCIYHRIDQKLGNDCNIGSQLECEFFESFKRSFDSVLTELLKTNSILLLRI
jgi:hypothetical protein